MTKRRGVDRGPLRKVIAEGVNEHGVHTETLSCGHVVRRRQDFIGYTNAYQRRCRFCKKASATP